jgi:glutamate synthase domain-containing protein 1
MKQNFILKIKSRLLARGSTGTLGYTVDGVLKKPKQMVHKRSKIKCYLAGSSRKSSIVLVLKKEQCREMVVEIRTYFEYRYYCRIGLY